MFSFEIENKNTKIGIESKNTTVYFLFESNLYPKVTSNYSSVTFENILENTNLNVNISNNISFSFKTKKRNIQFLASGENTLTYQDALGNIIFSTITSGKLFTIRPINDISLSINNNLIIINSLSTDEALIEIEFYDSQQFGPKLFSAPLPSSRPIYKGYPGPTSFSIYFFQGLNEGTIDYPFNLYNGIPITGTVPISPYINIENEDIINSYNTGIGLDSFTIYIEFVCNKIIATENFAPSLIYDVIPPTRTALASYDNIAEFVGNINDVSVYRGTYTVHKKNEPLYVDGIHTIRFKLQERSKSDLVVYIPRVVGYFMLSGSTIGGGSPLAP
jgi:hypothetical protein